MKKQLALLGAVLSMAGTSQAVIWTGEIWFTTTYTGPEEPAWYGYPPLGESKLWSTFLIDSDGDTPDGTYGNQPDLADSYRISLFGEPIPDDWPFVEWASFGLTIQNGIVSGLAVYEGDFTAIFSPEENFVYEDGYTWSTISFSDLRRVSDSGTTLPLAALSLFVLTAHRRRLKR